VLDICAELDLMNIIYVGHSGERRGRDAEFDP
jgi:hypothetical protein